MQDLTAIHHVLEVVSVYEMPDENISTGISRTWHGRTCAARVASPILACTTNTGGDLVVWHFVHRDDFHHVVYGGKILHVVRMVQGSVQLSV